MLLIMPALAHEVLGRKPQALGLTGQDQALTHSQGRRAPQSAGRQIQPLVLAVEHTRHGILQPLLQQLQRPQPMRTGFSHQFSRRRWRGHPQIGHEVGDGEVGLVTDTADDGHRALRHRARQAFIVEGPQVLHRAAATHQQDDIHHRF